MLSPERRKKMLLLHKRFLGKFAFNSSEGRYYETREIGLSYSKRRAFIGVYVEMDSKQYLCVHFAPIPFISIMYRRGYYSKGKENEVPVLPN